MRSWLVTESGLGVIIVRVESHLAQVQGSFASFSLAWHVESARRSPSTSNSVEKRKQS